MEIYKESLKITSVKALPLEIRTGWNFNQVKDDIYISHVKDDIFMSHDRRIFNNTLTNEY